MMTDSTRQRLIRQTENGPQGKMALKSFTMVVEHSRTALIAIQMLRRSHKDIPIYVACSEEFRLSVDIWGLQKMHYARLDRLGEEFLHIRDACERYGNTMFVPTDVLSLVSVEDVDGYDVIVMPNYRAHKNFEDLMRDDFAEFLSDYLFVGNCEVANIFEAAHNRQEDFEATVIGLPDDTHLGFFPPEHMYDNDRPTDIDIHPKTFRMDNANESYTNRVKDYLHKEYPGISTFLDNQRGFEDATYPMTQEHARPFPDLIALGSPEARVAIWSKSTELPYMYPTQDLETNYLSNMPKVVKGHRWYKHQFTATKEISDAYCNDEYTVQVDCSEGFGQAPVISTASVLCVANPKLTVLSIVSDPIEKAMETYLSMRPQTSLENLMRRNRARNIILSGARQAAQIRPYLRLLGRASVLVWDRDIYNENPGLHMYQLQKFVGIKEPVKEGHRIAPFAIEQEE